MVRAVSDKKTTPEIFIIELQNSGKRIKNISSNKRDGNTHTPTK